MKNSSQSFAICKTRADKGVIVGPGGTIRQGWDVLFTHADPHALGLAFVGSVKNPKSSYHRFLEGAAPIEFDRHDSPTFRTRVMTVYGQVACRHGLDLELPSTERLGFAAPTLSKTEGDELSVAEIWALRKLCGDGLRVLEYGVDLLSPVWLADLFDADAMGLYKEEREALPTLKTRGLVSLGDDAKEAKRVLLESTTIPVAPRRSTGELLAVPTIAGMVVAGASFRAMATLGITESQMRQAAAANYALRLKLDGVRS